MSRTEIMPIMYTTLEVYNRLCKPYCKEVELPQTAFDILMFLANHPQYSTARDIIRCRGIQANLVSAYVELLVSRGLLRREPIPGNRRSVRLVCTEQAAEIIDNGRRIQKQFFELLYEGVSPEGLEIFYQVLQQLAENVQSAKKQGKKENTL